ncbi:ANR family transcriptional regulator [Vibrio sp. 10N.247.311.51]|uniref:ANR family transcriptional regulator n=1 Tax=Vibrio sp. 10N.247.311.51 TaxID=3229996 RepID=UPI0035511744
MQYDESVLLSEYAAELERRGYYFEASAEWFRAARVSSSKENKAWCISRYEFCRRKMTLEYGVQ